MNTHVFLSDNNVIKLIAFIKDMWSGGLEFDLGVKIRGKAPIYIRINSIHEAFEKYLWEYSINTDVNIPDEMKKGKSFEDCDRVITYTRNMIIQNGIFGSDTELRNATEIILRWGGVFKKGNKDKVKEGYSLKDKFTSVQSRWQDINNNNKEFDYHETLDFTSNAGFTKVYSLFLNDFIIYDSRVAVALAYLIDKCFNGDIPETLKLFIPSSAVSVKMKRPVNSAFSPTNQKDNKHFYSNVLSSILLKEVISEINSTDLTLRKLEAALFMIGYDIRNTKGNSSLVN